VTEIDRVREALRRHEARVDAMSDRWRREKMPCCPSCAFGETYKAAADQCDRTRRWLIKLLRKRGTPADLAEVRRLELDLG
jgi:hypothetical protein